MHLFFYLGLNQNIPNTIDKCLRKKDDQPKKQRLAFQNEFHIHLKVRMLLPDVK